MKQLFLLPFLTLMLFACGGPEGQEVTSGDAVDTDEAGTMTTRASQEYAVIPGSSKIIWEGTKIVGGGHTGEFPVEFGQMVVADGQVVAGQFSMDLRKMTNTDMPADEGGDKLVGHLKSADFFDVEKYPMAQFVLAGVSPTAGGEYSHELVGNLTLKGKTRSVKIPANITIDGDKMMANTPKFTIDRNEWDITYGNSTLDIAKDKMISDEVGLEIKLVANKTQG